MEMLSTIADVMLCCGYVYAIYLCFTKKKSWIVILSTARKHIETCRNEMGYRYFADVDLYPD